MHALIEKMGDGQAMSVFVLNYHDGEYPIDSVKGAHIMYFWTPEMEGLLEFLKTDEDEDSRKRTALGYLNTQLPKEIWLKGFEVGQTLYRLWGKPESVLAHLEAYAAMLSEDVAQGGPGADDGTYDYFPGAVEACQQIAEAFVELHHPLASQAVKAYNDLVTAARETHYRDNEEADDLLPFMEV